MEVHHIWFPTHGRMRRRIQKRRTESLAFRGQIFSINPFRLGLVYEKVPAAGVQGLGQGAVVGELNAVADDPSRTAQPEAIQQTAET
jgi:hypothetical protein